MSSTQSMNLQTAFEVAKNDLQRARGEETHWEGCLASSALSTATAVSALAALRDEGQHDFVAPAVLTRLIDEGIAWLIPRQNRDGGWGDTDKSKSNISTTMLVRAAVQLAGVADRYQVVLDRAGAYTRELGGVEGLRRRYGKDKTFAVPIVTNCALAGLVGWDEVSPLPFELACLPQSFYRFVKMPVVSYAIPALVAVGQVIHARRPSRNWLNRAIRNAAITPSLTVLKNMQPASGGYLEAIPLTSFVVMSLIGAGQGGHDVVRSGIRFLVDTMRDDGSWPIDTNLATWNTTLAINALCQASDDTSIDPSCRSWLESCQHTERHPFTGAEPGGWGWSDLSGAVPDADDTPGALLALRSTSNRGGDGDKNQLARQRAQLGIEWLLNLQNRDGGWPTFCRGWGTLPFDRSGSDLTAHAIRGIFAWREEVPLALQRRMGGAIERGFAYLARQQRPDGSWYPLWFGNQDHPEEENPVYGTAKVLLAYRDTDGIGLPQAQKAIRWLIAAQLQDGGWNAGFVERSSATDVESRQRVETSETPALSIVEETALAVEALLSDNTQSSQHAARRGIDWLIEAVREGRHLDPTPIGFYFAKLWYYEELYPLLFTVSALGAAVHRLPDRRFGTMSNTNGSATGEQGFGNCSND